MVKDHRDLTGIPDDTVIWRYMALDKFLWMMNHKSLYLGRIDKFEDSQEGRLSLLDKQLFDYDKNPDYWEKERKRHFVCCWISCEHELSLMWQNYAKNGIAIKTTAKRLRDSMSNDTQHTCYLCQIQYIDFQDGCSHNTGENINVLKLFFTKRDLFKQEQEIRLLCSNYDNIDIDNLCIPIDLDSLIEEIKISPYADNVCRDLINDIMAQNGLTGKVHNSDM